MTRSAPPTIFNRARVRRARARTAATFAEHDFLHRRAMADIVDRLETVTRSFDRALVFGAGDLVSMLTPACGVGDVVSADSAAARLPAGLPGVVFDEELSPLVETQFDLIISMLTLHAANDPVGALGQMRMALKPDGLLIAATFGEETLARIKTALIGAEAELGGVGARFAPFAGVRDYGAALQRAGFAMPVADLETVSVRYREPARLFADLRGMGETRILARRPAPLARSAFRRALDGFAAAGAEERFDIVYLTGWAPAPTQPQPLKPGSATASLEKAVKRAGDK